jgi:hypothetical protein
MEQASQIYLLGKNMLILQYKVKDFLKVLKGVNWIGRQRTIELLIEKCFELRAYISACDLRVEDLIKKANLDQQLLDEEILALKDLELDYLQYCCEYNELLQCFLE